MLKQLVLVTFQTRQDARSYAGRGHISTTLAAAARQPATTFRKYAH